MQNDCFSGILLTATQLNDISKVFDKQPRTDLEWTMFAVEPLFTAIHFALSFNTCLLTTDFYSEYN